MWPLNCLINLDLEIFVIISERMILLINLLTLELLVTSSHQSKNIEQINHQEDAERVFRTAKIIGGKDAPNLGIEILLNTKHLQTKTQV